MRMEMAELPHNSSMAKRLIPLFPLQVVVFPRTRLPLHIFEERYKKMVGEAIRDSSEFGIVLAKEEGIVNAGCTVGVEKLIQMYPDGRMDILTRGRQRFEIESLDEEMEFLRANVNFFDDEDFEQAPPEVRSEALAQFRVLRELQRTEGHGEADLEDPQLSFQLAQDLPDLDFLSGLLRRRSELARLKELNRYLANYIPRQKTIQHVKSVAPRNGFGGKHLGL
jgi:Lon protease-like protein